MDALVLKHLALECTGLNAAGDLIRIEGPDPEPLFRVYVARHAGGDSVLFREDVPEATRKRLLRLPVLAFFEQPEAIKSILAEDAPCTEMHIGKSYVFAQPPNPNIYREVVVMEGKKYPSFVVVIDGAMASICDSSRENEVAGEAWVRTLEPYRRKGYARQTTAAWGAHLLSQGKTPFYSHRWDNLASQAVAQSLGLVEYLQDAGYV
jgi:hypothetical protein